MDCIVCGSPAGYNRAVVDTVIDEEIGGCCLQCEERVFDPSLVSAGTPVPGDCWVCTRDGFYALPQWTSYCQKEGADVNCTLEYRIEDDTLRLCDEHYDWIARSGYRSGATLPTREDRQK